MPKNDLRDSILEKFASVGLSVENTGVADAAEVVSEPVMTEKTASVNDVDTLIGDIDGFLKEASDAGLAEPLGGDNSTAVVSEKGEQESAANASGSDARASGEAPLASDQASDPSVGEDHDDLGGDAPYQENDKGESENGSSQPASGDTQAREASPEEDKLAYTQDQAAQALETEIAEEYMLQSIAAMETEKLASYRKTLQTRIHAEANDKVATAAQTEAVGNRFSNILFL